MKVLIDRDSVHPGDDVNHEGTVRAPRSTAVGQFLSDYAPRLSFTNGTDACWVIEQGSLVGDRTAIGVWPQHWKPGNLLDVSVRTLGDLIGEGEPALYFRYHPGLDPAIVLDLLKQGKLSRNQVQAGHHRVINDRIVADTAAISIIRPERLLSAQLVDALVAFGVDVRAHTADALFMRTDKQEYEIHRDGGLYRVTAPVPKYSSVKFNLAFSLAEDAVRLLIRSIGDARRQAASLGALDWPANDLPAPVEEPRRYMWRSTFVADGVEHFVDFGVATHLTDTFTPIATVPIDRLLEAYSPPAEAVSSPS